MQRLTSDQIHRSETESRQEEEEEERAKHEGGGELNMRRTRRMKGPSESKNKDV